MQDMFEAFIQSDEKKLVAWKDRVHAIVAKDDIMSKSTKPSIVITYGDTGGTIRVQSILSDDVSKMLRKNVKNIGNDLFLLSCLGSFSLDPKDISLNCSVINEDGIPVDIIKSEIITKIDAKAKETRVKILNSFDEL